MIIAFAKDWSDVPTSATHLLRGMARNMPVLWIESIGTRAPSLGSGRDLRRILRRFRAAVRGPQRKENQLWVWSPLLIPGARGRWGRTVNRRLLQWTIRRWRQTMETHALSGASGGKNIEGPGSNPQRSGTAAAVPEKTEFFTNSAPRPDLSTAIPPATLDTRLPPPADVAAVAKPWSWKMRKAKRDSLAQRDLTGQDISSPKSAVYGPGSMVSSPSGDEYWCFVPNAVDLLPANCRVIYYCVDDWTKFENLDGDWLGRKERELLQRADIVFAVSRDLIAKCRQIAGDRTNFMPHGVDYDLFRSALDPDTMIPSELKNARRPIIGFYGNLSPWIDFKLVRELVAARPDWTFIMLGPVYVDLEKVFGSDGHDGAGVDAKNPRRIRRGYKEDGAATGRPASAMGRPASATRTGLPSNILFPGRREHAELPAWCKAFDAAIIPYDPDHPRMASVHPVKARELLAAGVPIVSCDIEAMRGYGDDVLIAGRDVDAWLAALEKQIARRDREAISRRRAADDWSRRVAQIRAIVEGRQAGRGYEDVHAVSGAATRRQARQCSR